MIAQTRRGVPPTQTPSPDCASRQLRMRPRNAKCNQASRHQWSIQEMTPGEWLVPEIHDQLDRYSSNDWRQPFQLFRRHLTIDQGEPESKIALIQDDDTADSVILAPYGRAVRGAAQIKLSSLYFSRLLDGLPRRRINTKIAIDLNAQFFLVRNSVFQRFNTAFIGTSRKSRIVDKKSRTQNETFKWIKKVFAPAYC